MVHGFTFEARPIFGSIFFYEVAILTGPYHLSLEFILFLRHALLQPRGGREGLMK